MDDGIIMKMDEPFQKQQVVSEREEEDEEEGMILVQPSSSRTLDNRLNPEAPDFVPGLETRLLANKIVDELTSYTRWSSASDGDISCGPRFDGIWSESCIQEQPPPSEPSNIIELEQVPLKELSRNEPEPENGSEKRGRCWDCKLM